jgi:putative O-methyltransferase
VPAPASYERIHYGLRPAKNVQRKMLVETFRRLSEFGTVSSYRYVGFGSTYFSDFSLFHKTLGIQNMVSIEKDVSNRKRFEFNRPFNCIKMMFGDSSEILPSLNWNAKTILWLDYDGPLAPSMLADVRFFCGSAQAGSFIVVTVNAEPYELGQDNLRMEELLRVFGRERIPPDFKEQELSGWGTSRVFRRILTAEILATLSERNGGLAKDNKMQYGQLFDFCYKDGDRMLTIGGLIFDQSQKTIYAKCGFEQLEFLRSSLKSDSKPRLIEVPKLTYREIRHLDRQLPRPKSKRLTSPNVPLNDIKQYETNYRYFPTFAETEV